MDPGRIGGCGAQPDAQAVSQQSSLNAGSSWDAQLPLWLTPQGFLILAGRHEATVSEGRDGTTVSFSVSTSGLSYPFTGRFDEAALLTHVETRLDDPVFGDMLVTADFDGYREFNGLRFPTSLVIAQGGYPTLNLRVTDVIPDTPASAEPPPRQASGGGAAGAAAGARPD